MITTVILFLIVLSILVFVHEFGHFLVAKKTGIKVEEFGFGLPPRIFSIKRGETIYSVNALPIGGFVKLLGEDEAETVSESQKDRAFFAKSKKVRVAALLSGVLMNFALAVFCFSIVYSKLGIPEVTEKVKVVAVLPDSPAEKAGLKEDDVIVTAAGRQIKSNEDFLGVTKGYLGKQFEIEVAREKDNPCKEKVLGTWPGLQVSCHGENMVFRLVPREESPGGEGPLGMVISQVEMKFYPFYKQIFLGTVEGFREAFAWLSLVFFYLLGIFHKLITAGTVPKDIAGPVGIFQITGEIGKAGILSVVQFVGVLSVNLAVVNVLPFPALDGGRLLFVAVEAVLGKRVKARSERLAHSLGMAVLLFILLLITINDIGRILETSGFASRVKSILPF